MPLLAKCEAQPQCRNVGKSFLSTSSQIYDYRIWIDYHWKISSENRQNLSIMSSLCIPSHESEVEAASPGDSRGGWWKSVLHSIPRLNGVSVTRRDRSGPNRAQPDVSDTPHSPVIATSSENSEPEIYPHHHIFTRPEIV